MNIFTKIKHEVLFYRNTLIIEEDMYRHEQDIIHRSIDYYVSEYEKTGKNYSNNIAELREEEILIKRKLRNINNAMNTLQYKIINQIANILFYKVKTIDDIPDDYLIELEKMMLGFKK